MDQENRKMKWDTTKIVLAITAGVAVLALVGLLVWMVMSGMITVNLGKQEPTTPADTILSYTATDEVAIAANGNIVANVADRELTNGQMQIHYWTQVYNFINTYGAYLSYFGLDFSKPLSEQMYDESTSWEEFFLEIALDSWSQMAIIAEMAEENGFTLSDEEEEYLQSIVDSLETSAVAYGYKSLAEMVDKEMGKGSTAEDYIAYVKLDYLCGTYVSYLQSKNAPTDAQIEEYYNANEEAVKSAGCGKDIGKVVDVRHILIVPEGGTLNSDGYTYSYTDAAWEAARQKAQLVYDMWLKGEKDEDSFAELAKKNSADGSASNGGLITDVAKGKTVEGFNEWLFEDGRKYGDHALVKTVYGYHVMFYVDTEYAWIRYCEKNYAGEIVTTMMTKFAEDYELETNYDKIAIGQVNLAGE